MAANVMEREQQNQVQTKDTTSVATRESGKPPKRRKKGLGKLAVFFIVLLFVLVAAVAVIVLDLFSIRTNYLNGVLQNIPIVKNLIPVEDKTDSKYGSMSKEQLITELESLKKISDADKAEIEALNGKIAMYVNDISTLDNKLKGLEDQQTQFSADKAEFDRLIALNDKNAYANFYKSVNPQNAELLYKEAVVGAQNDKALKNYVSTFKDMNEGEAASIFEQMIGTDMDLVVLILKNIDSETRGAILGKMKPASAASVTKMMVPQNNQ